MSKTDFYQMHRIIHSAELRELQQAVTDFGGEAHFGTDYTGPGATGHERPVICVNRYHGEGPEDVFINAISVKEGCMDILAETKEYGDEFTLEPSEIEFGHVSFITDAIPDGTDHGEPSIIKTATFTTVSGEWISVNTDDHTWEYQRDADDDETYASGGYQTDDDRPCTVIDYDGCFCLPFAVHDALRRLGYAIDL
ncbi:MAG: hypothetical protein IJV08_11470 [Bacteroidaceae bacterium]|nr:hypothetical protein [Bacteroidaceae bacterium]MBR1449524.1 hypothetical protein [Prevotella sp.]